MNGPSATRQPAHPAFGAFDLRAVLTRHGSAFRRHRLMAEGMATSVDVPLPACWRAVAVEPSRAPWNGTATVAAFRCDGGDAELLVHAEHFDADVTPGHLLLAAIAGHREIECDRLRFCGPSGHELACISDVGGGTLRFTRILAVGDLLLTIDGTARREDVESCQEVAFAVRACSVEARVAPSVTGRRELRLTAMDGSPWRTVHGPRNAVPAAPGDRVDGARLDVRGDRGELVGRLIVAVRPVGVDAGPLLRERVAAWAAAGVIGEGGALAPVPASGSVRRCIGLRAQLSVPRSDEEHVAQAIELPEATVVVETLGRSTLRAAGYLHRARELVLEQLVG